MKRQSIQVMCPNELKWKKSQHTGNFLKNKLFLSWEISSKAQWELLKWLSDP